MRTSCLSAVVVISLGESLCAPLLGGLTKSPPLVPIGTSTNGLSGPTQAVSSVTDNLGTTLNSVVDSLLGKRDPHFPSGLPNPTQGLLEPFKAGTLESRALPLPVGALPIIGAPSLGSPGLPKLPLGSSPSGLPNPTQGFLEPIKAGTLEGRALPLPVGALPIIGATPIGSPGLPKLPFGSSLSGLPNPSQGLLEPFKAGTLESRALPLPVGTLPIIGASPLGSPDLPKLPLGSSPADLPNPSQGLLEPFKAGTLESRALPLPVGTLLGSSQLAQSAPSAPAHASSSPTAGILAKLPVVGSLLPGLTSVLPLGSGSSSSNDGLLGGLL